jgi:hypothetical protein
MVDRTDQGDSSSWRVTLRAEQFVWHNKEFPATFIPLENQAGLLAQNLLEPLVVFSFHIMSFDGKNHRDQQLP